MEALKLIIDTVERCLEACSMNFEDLWICLFWGDAWGCFAWYFGVIFGGISRSVGGVEKKTTYRKPIKNLLKATKHL